MKKFLGIVATVIGGVLLLPAAANAAVTFDAATGTGFVGKGDVQLVFGWSNAQLQANAGAVTFRSEQTAIKVTEVSWVCRNAKNEQIQERERTTATTTTSSAVVSAALRDNRTKQVTGFNLIGNAGVQSTSTTANDGPPVNSCPNSPNSPWFLETPAGDPVTVEQSSTGTLYTEFNNSSQPIYQF